MKQTFTDILKKEELSRDNIITLLNANSEDSKLLFAKSEEIRLKYVGNKVYLRGLIELSNICGKDCLYCGIRKSNKNICRYNLTDEEVLKSVKYAYENNYASLVIQSGELENKAFAERINNLLVKIKKLTKGKLHITLSCGEQSEDTYLKWNKNGANRYLLRIESSTKELYNKIHPNNKKHSFEKRIEALNALRKTDYQTGTGIMIGLPFQTIGNLADDLLFMRKVDIDMVGMGPYLEQKDTPLYDFRNTLKPIEERFFLTLKMIAVLRILMKEINIAATTALEAIENKGREKAVKAGANVIMPNITPAIYRENYMIYENKPLPSSSEILVPEKNLNKIGYKIGWGEFGDSAHFCKRFKKK
ncbi:MAG: [FeFe] hydrogenase H-cluster radical SAM maturase HydE [Bacteroidales bacterium]|nr:[FeFe] hydrogenase H-cluster radical SAM maturase HydE [Bacteroidales bacterium]